MGRQPIRGLHEVAVGLEVRATGGVGTSRSPRSPTYASNYAGSIGCHPTGDAHRGVARVGVLLVSILLVIVATDRSANAAPPPGPRLSSAAAPPAPSISPDAVNWLSDRLVELTFTNPVINPPLAKTKVRILVPAGYADSGKRYPMVLLLHGIGDTSSAWTKNQDGWPKTLETFTAGKDVIVVMPDAGQNGDAGWYTDWYNNGAYGTPRWETYHLVQLLDYVDRSFPTRGDRNGRVVAGLSMGGFGTMSYAARHPDLFAGAFSFSGALDSTNLVFTPEIWGLRATEEVRQRGHNPIDLADNLADTRVWFRTGMGLPGGPGPKDNTPGLEPAIWPTNERFAQALSASGVPYFYEAYPMGGHNWWHWQEGFQLAWPSMQKLFDAVIPPPATFRYRSVESPFRIWGWDVEARRSVVEFLQMRAVSTEGLELEGSGLVLLTTPPAYEPGRSYNIEAKGPTAAVAPAVVVADAQGRLQFEVTLGPSHTQQQYTAAQRAQAAADPRYWQAAKVHIAAAPITVTPAELAATPPTPTGDVRPLPRLPETGSLPFPEALPIALAAGYALLASVNRRASRPRRPRS